MNQSLNISIDIINRAFDVIDEKSLDLFIIEESDKYVSEESEKESLTSCIKSIKEKIRESFVNVYQKGSKVIKSESDAIKKFILVKLNHFKDKSEMISNILNKWLSKLSSELVNQGISTLVPIEFKVGEIKYILSNISLEWEISFSGDLEMSVVRLFKFAASGKLNINAEYIKVN